jgi:transitional endoplasmic reticulum ATPase
LVKEAFPMDYKSITVKAEEARQRDFGRGKVRIDDASMRAIGIVTGDIIELQGKDVSVPPA